MLMWMSGGKITDTPTERVHAVNGDAPEWRDDHLATAAPNETKNRSKSSAWPLGQRRYFNIFPGAAGGFFLFGAAFARAETAAASARRAQGSISWGDSIASSGAVK